MAKKTKKTSHLAQKCFSPSVNGGRAFSVSYSKGEVNLSQGEPAAEVFYLQRRKVKLTVISEQGKEAIVAVFGS